MSQKPLDKRLAEAVRHYWKTRLAQDKRQGARAGRKDQGNRAAVTGGAQLDGFVKLMRGLLVESGIPDATIHTQQTALPGFFRPTKGYFMLLEDEPRSTSPVSVQEPHFKVFEEFRDASYARRYQLFCERLYDATCFLMSDRKHRLKRNYSEPAEELSFRNFAISLTARAGAYVRQRE